MGNAEKHGVIFSSAREDIFVNFVGLLSLLFAFYLAWAPGLLNQSMDKIVLITDYAAFNTLHLPLTFVMLFTLPELRSWQRAKPSRFPSFSWDIFFVCLLFLCSSIYGFSILHVPNRHGISPNAYVLLGSNLLFIVLRSFHALGQNMGLSNLIHSGPGQARHAKAEFRERTLFYLIIVAFMIYLAAEAITDFNIWETRLAHLKTLAGFLLVTTSVGIVLNGISYPKGIRLKKVLFLSRVLHKPLMLINPVSGLLANMNHGVEYVFVSKKMISNSEMPEIGKRRIKIFMLLGVILWAVLVLPRYFEIRGHIDPVVFQIFIGCLTVVDLAHYWLDRVIFRMRTAESRTYVLPILQRSP